MLADGASRLANNFPHVWSHINIIVSSVRSASSTGIPAPKRGLQIALHTIGLGFCCIPRVIPLLPKAVSEQTAVMDSSEAQQAIQQSRRTLLDLQVMHTAAPALDVLREIGNELTKLSWIASRYPEIAAQLVTLVVEWVELRDVVKNRLN